MMVLKTETDDPETLATEVGQQLINNRLAHDADAWLIADFAVRPVLDTCGIETILTVVFNNAAKSTRRQLYRQAKRRVRAAAGIGTWILFRFVFPIVIRWVIDWYFSDRGAAMRARMEGR